MDIYQGDIVWISFPFTDGIRFKFRPALVLSKNSYNKTSDDLLLAYITSQKKSRYLISIEKSDIVEGALPMQSYIRYDKILLVEKSRIQGIIAIVTKDYYRRVISKIFEFIDLE
jgi:mRNA-degrading endonuclease toxin of MazEF toxin-antitoxin module